MNNLYAQSSVPARFWAVLTMFAVVLSAFSAPFSVAFAEESSEILEPVQPTEEVQEVLETAEELVVENFTEEDTLLLIEDAESQQIEEVDMQIQMTEISMMRGGHKPKVTICHATASPSNPFTKNTVDVDGLNGHDDHVEDIIPAIIGFPNGQNLETVYGDFTGAQILENDCKIPKVVKLSITKIVCEDESSLPNGNFQEITADTASTFLSQNPTCAPAEDWKFQYSLVEVAGAEDNAGELDSPWITTDKTNSNGNVIVTLPENSVRYQNAVLVREVWSPGYIPFTGENGSDISAELYCHTDINYYDNLEWISDAKVEDTYHCVAWNVPVEPTEPEDPAPVCEVDVNLLTNGGFESPVVVNAAGWDIFNLTTYPGFGWVVAWMNGGGAPALASLEIHGGVNGWLATEGDQYAELDSDFDGPGGSINGEAASVAISQTVPTTLGQNYSLSWSFSPRPGTAADQNVLEVLVDNVVVKTNTAAGAANTVWTADNYAFVGTGAPVTVTFRDAGISNSEGTFLDNVSLNCRPADDSGDNGGEDGEGEPTVPTPTSSSSGGNGSAGRLGQSSGTPTVAGDSISTPSPEPMVLGEQVTAVPYGAPGTGHGGTSTQTSGLTLLQILFTSRKLELVK
jgi:hypothetical protein